MKNPFLSSSGWFSFSFHCCTGFKEFSQVFLVGKHKQLELVLGTKEEETRAYNDIYAIPYTYLIYSL